MDSIASALKELEKHGYLRMENTIRAADTDMKQIIVYAIETMTGK